MSPKMSARSGLVGKNPPGPIWAHLDPFFAWAGKMQNSLIFAYFPWWANGPYSAGLAPGAAHLRETHGGTEQVDLMALPSLHNHRVLILRLLSLWNSWIVSERCVDLMRDSRAGQQRRGIGQGRAAGQRIAAEQGSRAGQQGSRIQLVTPSASQIRSSRP